MVRIESVLAWLTYVIALVPFVPLFPYLDPAPRLMLPAALIAGILVDRRGFRLPDRFPTVASVAVTLFYLARVTRENPAGPAVNLLVLLVAVRLVSEKNVRHHLQVCALALFALAGLSLFDLSALFLVYLALLYLLISVSLVFVNFCETESPFLQRRQLRKTFVVATGMTVVSIPLIILFFVILPRTQFPLWNVMAGGGASTGFTDTVSPGAAPSVTERTGVVFRAHCPPVAKSALYWRGIVLNAFDGRTWSRGAPPSGKPTQVAGGERIVQEIYPEPGGPRYLFALNVPGQVSGIRSESYPDHVFTVANPGRRFRYRAVSVSGGVIAAAALVDRTELLALPADTPRRLVALGRDIARRGRGDRDRFALLENYYRSSSLSYATSGLPVGPDAPERFLFDTKRGHCELFASSFAIVLRAAGIPSRLVGGYYGGEYNDLGGYYTVTEDRAHVWVEAYLAGSGWVSVDPSVWAVNFTGEGRRTERGFSHKVRLALDTLGYFWNQVVINYDLERQFAIMNRAGSGLRRISLRVARPSPREVGTAALCIVLVALVVVALRHKGVSREGRILAAFLSAVRKRYDVEPDRECGLFNLASRLRDPLVDEFVTLYSAAVYRDRTLAPAERHRLFRIISELRGKAHSS